LGKPGQDSFCGSGYINWTHEKGRKKSAGKRAGTTGKEKRNKNCQVCPGTRQTDRPKKRGKNWEKKKGAKCGLRGETLNPKMAGGQ